MWKMWECDWRRSDGYNAMACILCWSFFFNNNAASIQSNILLYLFAHRFGKYYSEKKLFLHIYPSTHKWWIKIQRRQIGIEWKAASKAKKTTICIQEKLAIIFTFAQTVANKYNTHTSTWGAPYGRISRWQNGKSNAYSVSLIMFVFKSIRKGSAKCFAIFFLWIFLLDVYMYACMFGVGMCEHSAFSTLFSFGTQSENIASESKQAANLYDRANALTKKATEENNTCEWRSSRQKGGKWFTVSFSLLPPSTLYLYLVSCLLFCTPAFFISQNENGWLCVLDVPNVFVVHKQ